MDKELIEKLSELNGKGYATLDEASSIELVELAIIFYKKYSNRIYEYFETLRVNLIDSSDKEEQEFFDYLTRLAVMIVKRELEKEYQKFRQGGQNNG